MPQTVEAVMNEKGEIRLLQPIRVSGCRRVLVTLLDEPSSSEPPAAPPPPDNTRLLRFLDELERLPFSTRTTEEMNAEIQAERDAWD